ncbi:MAG: plasmid mobilization protein [Verrucomicrobiaceae bacterium]|jgi:hypothetical protein
MSTVTFKASDQEVKRLRANAHKAKVSVSEFIRRKLFNHEQDGTVTLQRCQHTGAMIFAPAPHLPPLSTESVHDMLGDFP